MRARTLVLATLLMALPLAGCLGAEGVPNERRFTATGGSVSPGWAYDGAGLVAASAALEGWANNADNVGQVNVSFTYMGATYAVVFDTFEEASGKTFQDGGIAFELAEHGDSGNGDAALPLLHAAVAAWGKATVTKDGAPITPEPWSAHLMVSHDTVRGADGKIANAAGAPYSPAAPTDAKRVENDPQAIRFIKHPKGETYATPPVNGTQTYEVAGSSQNIEIATIEAQKGAKAGAINYTVTDAAAAPLAAGQYTLRLLNASGEEIGNSGEQTITPGSVNVGAFAVEPAMIDGPLTVVVDGLGFFTIDIQYEVTYEDAPFLVVTWDEVTLS